MFGKRRCEMVLPLNSQAFDLYITTSRQKCMLVWSFLRSMCVITSSALTYLLIIVVHEYSSKGQVIFDKCKSVVKCYVFVPNLRQSELHGNPDATKWNYLRIGREVHLRLFFADGSGTPIPVSKLVKDLGVQADNMFSPSAQCTEVANRAKGLIFMIRRSVQDLSK